MDGDCVSLELTKKVQRATDRLTILSSGIPIGNDQSQTLILQVRRDRDR